MIHAQPTSQRIYEPSELNAELELEVPLPHPSQIFYRHVYCLLGLPFDAVTSKEAAQMLRETVRTGARCFLATPNINFVAEARRQPDFRDFLLRSDLATVDGMPLVWLARLMGLPIRERAAGADIFDALKKPHPDFDPLPVFFFGGVGTSAHRAHDATNATESNMVAVGSISPGFGSAEELSKDAFVSAINSSRAGMLVVALGAVKGHAWIQHNLQRISTPVVCHLGAVIGFASKQLRRAPQWMQATGFEWFWRLTQEPSLVRRYVQDAANLAPLLLMRSLPYLAWKRSHRLWGRPVPQRIDFQRMPNGTAVLGLQGDFTDATLDDLRHQIVALATAPGELRLVLDGVTYADPAFVGLLLLLRGYCDASGKRLTLVGRSQRIRRILEFNCAEYLIKDDPADEISWVGGPSVVDPNA